MVKISSIFVAFLENMNFTSINFLEKVHNFSYFFLNKQTYLKGQLL